MGLPDGAHVRALLAGQCVDGTFGTAPYQKRVGGPWRLVSHADLRCPPGQSGCDSLFGLRALADLGMVGDDSVSEALDVVEQKRRADGRWAADGRWWKSVGDSTYTESADWGESGPSEMVTFHALLVLLLAGRI